MNSKISPRIPSANSFSNPIKTGTLYKRTRNRIWKPKIWEKIYCVIYSSKLYYYDNVNSDGRNNKCGRINLKYFDSCEIFEDEKRKRHLFVIYQSEKLGFFDKKHIFSSNSEEEREEWVSVIKSIQSNRLNQDMDDICKEDSNRQSIALDKVVSEEHLKPVTKDRAKGPKGRRPPNRKSEYPNLNESYVNGSKSSHEFEIVEENNALEFMDESVKEERVYQYSSSEHSLDHVLDRTDDVEEEKKDIPENKENNNNKEPACVTMSLLKEMEKKWTQETEASKCVDNEQEISTISVSPMQQRQISISSERSARNSDQTSTYQLYLLDKDIRSLKRDVNSIQNNNKINQDRFQSVETKINRMEGEISTLKTDVEAISTKMDSILEIINAEPRQNEDDTLL